MKRTPKARIDYTDWTVEQHAEYLRTNPAHVEAYKQYDPRSIDTFIEEFAKNKMQILEDKQWYKERYEEFQTQYLVLAETYIVMILQKKLFNLQCQWRAERIKLPLVEACIDFEYWEQHARECPFIAPITQEEFDVCVAYLNDQVDLSSDECLGFPDGWQDYERFKNQLVLNQNEENEAQGLPLTEIPEYFMGEHLPNFYTFFDERLDTEHLIHLPDVKGQKEEVYFEESRRLYQQERQLQGEQTPINPSHSLPNLYSWGSRLVDFVNIAEDEDFKETYKHYSQFVESREDDADADYEYLKKVEGAVTIIGHNNWRESLNWSVRWHKQQKALEVLPYVYETYLMEFEEDLSVEELIAARVARFKFDENERYYKLYQYRKKELLDGRESLAGVRNFDF